MGGGVLLLWLKGWLHSECQILIFFHFVLLRRGGIGKETHQMWFSFFPACFKFSFVFKSASNLNRLACYMPCIKQELKGGTCLRTAQHPLKLVWMCKVFSPHNPCTSILNYFGVAITALPTLCRHLKIGYSYKISSKDSPLYQSSCFSMLDLFCVVSLIGF